jgi:hypothetical protein
MRPLGFDQSAGGPGRFGEGASASPYTPLAGGIISKCREPDIGGLVGSCNHAALGSNRLRVIALPRVIVCTAA